MRTPDGRAADLEKAAARVRRRYKTNTKTRRKFDIAGEEDVTKEMVMVLKLANYSHSQIGTIVGCSRGQVKEFVSDPKFQKKFLKLKGSLPQAALELGRAYLIEAVQTIVHVMRTSENEQFILKAANDLLDRFGIPKLSRLEKRTEEGGVLDHLGRGGHEDVLVDISTLAPEFQEKAAQLYDAFETGLKGLISEAKEITDEVSDDDQT